MTATTYHDLLRTAAVLATNHGVTCVDFITAAEHAYDGLIDQGYTPNTGPLPPADIPLQAGMPEKEGKILQFYAATEATKHRPPSIRETADELDIPQTTAHYRLRNLVKRGLMQHTPGETRNYRTRWS